MSHTTRRCDIEVYASRRYCVTHQAWSHVGPIPRDCDLDERADAARYRYLKPFLRIDGDVDDADNPSRHWNELRFVDDAAPLCDGWHVGDVDAAIDAMLAPAPPSETPHDRHP